MTALFTRPDRRKNPSSWLVVFEYGVPSKIVGSRRPRWAAWP